jgi:hypothetical protein
MTSITPCATCIAILCIASRLLAPRWGDKTMYCKEMLGSLSDYIDGDLEAQLCAEIEQHMAGCGNCRVVVDTLSKTVSLYREYGHEPVPPEAKDRLYAVLKLEAGS